MEVVGWGVIYTYSLHSIGRVCLVGILDMQHTENGEQTMARKSSLYYTSRANPKL